MAKQANRRLKPIELDADERVYAAVKDMDKYAPANAAYTHTALDAAHDRVQQRQHEEVQATAAAAAARDDANAEEWSYHDLMAGVKDQVVAQFGRNSNEAQAVGLKKPEEYKKPTRKAKKNGDGGK